jgi:hypothetical protein
MRILQKLFKPLFKTERQREEDWLAQSVDLVDLERRQRQLQFGKRVLY